MAKVPLPDRGQPLDLSYVYQLAEAINNLSNELSPVNAKYTTIDTEATGQQVVRTSDARIIGGYKDIVKQSPTSTEESFSYTFSNFAYPPIVTATTYATGAAKTQAAKDTTVVITEVTTGRVDGVVKFNTPGEASVRVNLTIIGIPV
jgi:hypothetical protein